jgi:hypothetical protein
MSFTNCLLDNPNKVLYDVVFNNVLEPLVNVDMRASLAYSILQSSTNLLMLQTANTTVITLPAVELSRSFLQGSKLLVMSSDHTNAVATTLVSFVCQDFSEILGVSQDTAGTGWSNNTSAPFSITFVNNGTNWVAL